MLMVCLCDGGFVVQERLQESNVRGDTVRGNDVATLFYPLCMDREYVNVGVYGESGEGGLGRVFCTSVAPVVVY